MSCLIEEWKDVYGFEGLYQISSFGGVRSLTRTVINSKLNRYGAVMAQVIKGKILKPHVCESGHLSVQLRKGGKAYPCYVHRLVLEAFVGPCPEGMECRHFPDRDPANNRLDNLQWGTKAENAADMAVHGTRRAGWTHTDEVKRRISRINKGRKHPNRAASKLKGKRLSQEIRGKMAAAQKKRYDEERARNGGFVIKNFTAEGLARMSAATKGKKKGKETLLKMSEAAKDQWKRFREENKSLDRP